jgi:D-aminopeptidase
MVGETQVCEFGAIRTPILLTCTLCIRRAANALKQWIYEQLGMGEHALTSIVGEANDACVNNMWADPIQEEVYAELNSASAAPVEEGSVGAGTDPQVFGWMGGIDTSSRALPAELGGYTVGVFVQENYGDGLSINGATVERELGSFAYRDFLEPAADTDKEDGSVIIVVATNAPHTARNLDRVARRAMMGLIRTSSFASNGLGDYVIAFSINPNVRKPRVSEVPVPLEVLVNESMTPLFAATAEAKEEAICNAIFKATMISSSRGELRAIPLQGLMSVLEKYQSLNWDQTIGK